MVPHPPALGGWPLVPGPVPLLLRRTPPGYICSAGVAWQPRAPGAAWLAVGGSAWRGGGGGAQCAVTPGARPGGPAGRGAGRSLCRGLFPRLLPAGTEAGRFVCALPSSLHSWSPPLRCGPGAPLSAGAGLPVGSGGEWAADFGHLTRGCAPHICGVPPLGAAALSGGGAGLSPPWLASGRPRAGGGRGGGGGGELGGFPTVPPWSPGPAPRRLRWGGLVVPVPGSQPPTGRVQSSPAPFHPLGARSLCRPSLGPPALLAAAAWCSLAGGGAEGRRVLGAAVGVCE